MRRHGGGGDMMTGLAQKVAVSELEKATRWLKEEHRKVDTKLEETSKSYLTRQMGLGNTKTMGSRKESVGEDRNEILGALRRYVDRFELLCHDVDDSSSGVLSINTIKDILLNKIGLVVDLDKLVAFLASYASKDGINYHRLLSDIRPRDKADVDVGAKLLVDEIKKKGVEKFIRKLQQKVSSRKLQHVTRKLFSEVVQECGFPPHMVPFAKVLYKSMDTAESGKLAVETISHYLMPRESETVTKFRDWIVAEFSGTVQLIAYLSNFDQTNRGTLRTEKLLLALLESGLNSSFTRANLCDVLTHYGLTEHNGEVAYKALVNKLFQASSIQTSQSPKVVLARHLYQILVHDYGSKPSLFFRHFDERQTGKLSRKSFVRSIEKLSIPINFTNEELFEIFDSSDSNHDSFVDFKEFEALLRLGKRGHSTKVKESRKEAAPVNIEHALRARMRSRSIMKDFLMKRPATTKGRITKSQLVRAFVKMLDDPSISNDIKAFVDRATSSDPVDIERFLDELYDVDESGASEDERDEDAAVRDTNVMFAKTLVDPQTIRNLLLQVDSWTLRRLFFSHDQDDNGALTYAQFGNVLETSGIKATRAEIRAIVRQLAKVLQSGEHIRYDDLMRFLSLQASTQPPVRANESDSDDLNQSRTVGRGTSKTTDPIQICRDQAMKYGVTRDSLIENFEDKFHKSSGDYISIKKFFHVLDSSLDLSSMGVRGENLVRAMEKRSSRSIMIQGGKVNYIDACQFLLPKTRQSNQPRMAALLRAVKKNGFASASSARVVFDLLGDEPGKAIDINLFAEGLAKLGIRDEGIVHQLGKEFQYPGSSKKVLYRKFIDELFDAKGNETIDDRLSESSMSLGNFEPPSDQSSGDEMYGAISPALADGSLDSFKWKHHSSPPTSPKKTQLSKARQLGGTTGKYSEKLKNLKTRKTTPVDEHEHVKALEQSYSAALHRNEKLEHHAWEHCANTGIPPPIDEAVFASTVKKKETSLLSGTLKRTVVQPPSTVSLGDRLRNALSSMGPEFLKELNDAFMNEMIGEGEEGIDVSIQRTVAAKTFSRVISYRIPKLSPGDVIELTKLFDKDGDGQVRFKEFLHVAEPLLQVAGVTDVSDFNDSFRFEASRGSAILSSDSDVDRRQRRTRTKRHTRGRAHSYLSESDNSGDIDRRQRYQSDSSSSGIARRQRKSRNATERSRIGLRRQRRHSYYAGESSDNAERQLDRRNISDDSSGDDLYERVRSDLSDSSGSPRNNTMSGSNRHSQRHRVLNDRQEKLNSAREKLRKYLTRASSKATAGGLLNLRNAFKQVDLDNNGLVDYQEFRKLLGICQLDGILRDGEQKYLFKEMDLDRNGAVTFDAFCKYFDELNTISPMKSPRNRQMVKERIRRKLDGSMSRKDFTRALRGDVEPIPLTKDERDALYDTLNTDDAIVPSRNADVALDVILSKLHTEIYKLATKQGGIINLRAAFNHFDTSRNGVISMAEFLHGLRKLGFHLNEKEEHALAAQLDVDKRGDMNLQKFVRFFEHGSDVSTEKKESETQRKKRTAAVSRIREKLRRLRVGPNLKRQFDHYDKNKSGSLSEDELQQMLQSLGVRLSKEDFAFLMKRLDTSNNGVVSFSEFQAFVDFDSGGVEGFVQMVKQKFLNCRGDIIRSFLEFDTDHDGTLDRISFEQVVESLRLDLTQKEIDLAFEVAASNDRINYLQLIRLMIDRQRLSKQFHMKHGLASHLYQVVKRALGTDEKFVAPKALKLALRQSSIMLPPWQLEALIIVHRSKGEGGVDVRAFCEDLESTEPSSVSKAVEESEGSIFQGTIASLVITIQKALKALLTSTKKKPNLNASYVYESSSSEGEEDSDTDMKVFTENWLGKADGIGPNDLHRALVSACRISIGEPDADVIYKIIDESATESMTYPEVTSGLLSMDTLRLALDIDRQTDPAATQAGSAMERQLTKILHGKCGNARDGRKAFSFLDRDLKGSVSVENILGVCKDADILISDTMWATQELILRICQDQAAVFARSSEGLSARDITEWLFPAPAWLDEAKRKVRNAIRDSSKRGGGAVNYRGIFDRFDTNHKGYLTRRDLKQAFRLLCPDLTPDQMNELVVALDASCDGGRITLSEFTSFFS